MFRILLFLLVLGMAADVAAKDDAKVQVDLKDFDSQHAVILKDLSTGETYKEINQSDRVAVQSALRRISESLVDAGGAENLSAAAKVKVFNDQELVNTVLTQAAADSQLICRREKKTGSHRTTTQCMTVAERDRAREHAEEMIRRRPSQQIQGD